MLAVPGESLHYTVDIPADQPPGLYWYHTHPHGESYQQDLDGISGAGCATKNRHSFRGEAVLAHRERFSGSALYR
jgi:FtsP/CotA-like multicopper oxidase with cupredoxin domain